MNNCAECGKPLTALDIQHGWVTSDLGWHRMPARVHTICRAKFEARPLEERRAKAEEGERDAAPR